MPVSSSSRLLALVAVLGLAACGPEYEIERPGTWHATGINDRNLRAMIADPRDVDYGIAATTDRGSGGTRAVNRLLNDRRRPLLNASLSRVSSGGGDSGDSGGGGGAAPPAAAASQ